MTYLIIQINDQKPLVKEFTDVNDMKIYIDEFYNGYSAVGITDNVYFINKKEKENDSNNRLE